MPRDREAGVVGAGERRGRLVHEVPLAIRQMRQAGVDAERRRHLPERAVVVADHEQYLRRGELPPRRGELGEHAIRAAALRVEQIAHDHEPPGGGFVDEPCEPGEVGLGRALGHGDAGLTKSRRLAEVQVGDEERGGRGQKGGAAR